jgi:AbrB family looped-hinge helix DNA binding protein
MKIATISSKNQITLPVSIMKALGLTAKSKVYIRVKDDKVVIEPVSKSVVEELGGSLTHLVSKDKLGKSLSEIDEVTRTEVAKHLATK